MKIDCIITTFNDENVISKCLKSIPKKILDLHIRVIISDDCSNDNTVNIAKNILKDREHKILTCEENTGVGKNRMRALREASNEYIFFLDSDDYIQKNNLIKDEVIPYLESDMIFFSKLVPYRNSQLNFEKEMFELSTQKNKKVDMDLLYGLILKYRLRMGECWGVIFKKSVINKYSINFINASVGEDVIFLLEYLLRSKSWSFYPTIVLNKTYDLGISSNIGNSAMESYLRILYKSLSLLENVEKEQISKIKIELYKFYIDSFIRSLSIHTFFYEYLKNNKIKKFRLSLIDNKTLKKNYLDKENNRKINSSTHELFSFLKKIINSDKNIKYCFWLASPLTFVYSRLLFLKHSLKVTVILDDSRKGKFNLNENNSVPFMKLEDLSLINETNLKFIIINQSNSLIKKLVKRTLLKYPECEIITMNF